MGMGRAKHDGVGGACMADIISEATVSLEKPFILSTWH
jgi:hypothetical protein